MKKWVLLGMGCFLVAMTTFAEEQVFRIFTAKDGRPIEARIVEYDAKKGKIQIERRVAGKVWVVPGVFGEADQAYIKEWVAVSAFLAKTSLRVSMDKQIEDRFGSKNEFRKGERVLYEISVKNNSPRALEGLRVEYRYFFRRVADDDRPEGARTISGTDVLPAIDPAQTVKFKTIPTDVVERYSKTVTKHNTVTGETETTKYDGWEDELQGIWIRIYGPEVGGTPLYRDSSAPDNLMEEVEWGEADSPYIEKIKARGWAISRREYSVWCDEAAAEVNEAKDEERAREIGEAFEVFHNPLSGAGVLLAAAFYYNGFDEQSALYAGIIAESKENYAARVILVDLLSSSPDSSVRDGERAVEQALALIKETSPDNTGVLDLLARAYARNEQFELAEVTQKKAVASLPTRKRKRYEESFKTRLALYANGQPYTRGKQDVQLWEVFYTINKVFLFPNQADLNSTLLSIYSGGRSNISPQKKP